MAQELISHKVLSLDFWQDTVTYAGSVMPTGTIGCAFSPTYFTRRTFPPFRNISAIASFPAPRGSA